MLGFNQLKIKQQMKLFKPLIKLFLKAEYLIDYGLMEQQILLPRNFKIMLNRKKLFILQLMV